MGLEALLEERTEEPDYCKVGRIVQSLEEPYRSALVKLLATPYINGGESDTAIVDRLRKAEIPASAPSINRHRRGICSCPKRVEEVVG